MYSRNLKLIVFIVVLTIVKISFGQENYLRIELKPENEYHFRDYHLYQNDSLIHTNCFQKNDISTLFNLAKGNYKLVYETIFGIDSLNIEFDTEHNYKNIILHTEKPNAKKLAETFSHIESLKNNEQITLIYHLGDCYVSKEKKATILKENDQYYFVDYGHKRWITERRIQKIIRYEKILQLLNFSETLHGKLTMHQNCNESFSLTKNGEQVYAQHVFCGTWTASSNIKGWMR
jgi:hypothetical protein